MIALKKLYGDELLRLALILSLLKANPNDYLERETQLLTAGLHISNGTDDWSLEQEARTLITPRYVHPKSLDHVLAHHERRLFEELNSLGRYRGRYDVDNERISNLNPIVHTYLLNNVATDTIAPALVEVAAPVADDAVVEGDAVSADDNVGQEIKVEEETQQERRHQPDLVVTLTPDFLINRTESDIFAEIATRTFDVSEFLVDPPEMRIKKEPESDLFAIKKEKQDQDDLYNDNAMDDFVPYFAAQSKKYSESDVFDQNISDLQDYEEAFDDLKDFKRDLEYLDVKQQQENLEQYLLENTPLDAEVYDLAPIFEEELVLDVKRERASTSFTSASSSGVSEMEILPELSEEVKTEPDEGGHTGDELTQEDMDLIEVLWKQDVDMGFSLDETHPLDGPQATKVLGEEIENALKFAEEELQKEKEFERMEKEKQEIEEVKASLLKEDGVIKEDDPWAGLAYTVDTETGEYVLQCDSREAAAPDDRFDFLEEALQLVELGDPAPAAAAAAPAPTDVCISVTAPSPAEASPPAHDERVEAGRSEGAGAGAGAMLHPAVARHALPHHHHHLTAHYHNQSLMRSMSVEQRWQDLASLLTIPPPPPEQYPHAAYHPAHAHPHHAHQQHPHNISAHGAAGGYPSYGHLPATADKHPDAYGAATPLDGAYKVESAHHPQQHEGLYYQNGGGGEMGNSDGFLQSILNDEDLQLMDMAMNEGMYTMRMLDGSGAGAAHAPPPHHNHNIMMTAERDSASDSAVSSMGSERVPSLSDGEWCDAGSDSAQDYHSSKFRPYEASFGRERAQQQPPQKKHHMFGKRCFQEAPPVPAEPPAPVKYEYPPEQPAAYHRHEPTPLAPSVAEYPSRHALPQPHTPLQPVLDLNAAHSSHALIQGGVPPMGGRYGPYPGAAAAPERVRHNHTYSAPLTAAAAAVGEHARPAVRDKRVRRLTDGSMSDGGAGSTSGHLTRDEKRAKALGIPLEVHDIINLPMDEFNERLSKHDLSEAQLSLIRDIRRRGKNKVAAQNCRKRKLDQITSLADEVRTVRDRKVRTQREHQTLLADRQRLKERFAALYRHVFQNLRDAEGRPLSSAQYSLQQAADGSVVLVPKMNHSDHPMNRTSDDEMERKAKNFEQ